MNSKKTSRRDPLADSRAFRRCLAQFGTGVTVVTAVHAGEPIGMTANSFTSVSLDPPLVLWCIGRNSSHFTRFIEADSFCINILSKEHVAISRQFSSKDTDRFAGVNWSTQSNGAPALDEAVGVLVCRRHALHEAGDHVLVLGRVEGYARRAGVPLLYVQGRYAVAEDHPDIAGTVIAPSAGVDQADLGGLSFSRLLFRAYRTMSNGFEDHRRQEHLTFDQSRVLFGIAEQDDLSPREIADAFYLSLRATEDAITELRTQQLVDVTPEGRAIITSKGHERCRAVRDRVEQYEAMKLSTFPAEQVEMAKGLLASVSRLT